MINNYEVPEVLEIGRAQDVVLGDPKSSPIIFESPAEPWRHPEDMNDDE